MFGMVREESSLFGVGAALACLLALATECFGANLAMGNQGGVAGFGTVVLPITLSTSAGEEVACGQCDVVFDPSALNVSIVSAGAATQAAGKSVSYSVISAGRVRVLVSGFNLNAISDGEIARLAFNISGDALEGVQPVALSAIVLSDPSGTAVPATSNSGSIAVRVEPLPTGFTRLPGVGFVSMVFMVLFAWGARRWSR
jgi:hypothetical protein